MPHVPTTAGETDVADLGVVLMHEHVFIRTETLQLGWPGFGGWDAEAEVAAARDRLSRLGQAGVGTILDMTIPGLYRDPALVARAAEGTGVKVMFATGYYTYDQLPFPFQFRGRGRVLDDEDRMLESLFERDVTTGIGDTGFRAAVLKIVTDEPGMTPDVERLALAVANVHARTGVPVCTHAHALSRRGLDQQRILAAHGADLGRVMIGHSNETADLGYLEQIISAAPTWAGTAAACRSPCRWPTSWTPWPSSASAATPAGSCCPTTSPRSPTGSPTPSRISCCPTGSSATSTARCCPAWPNAA